MSYADIANIADSASLRRRLSACAAQEGKGGVDGPVMWVEQRAIRLAASPGWAAAWASALAGGITDPGTSEAVITDGMILAAVQPMT